MFEPQASGLGGESFFGMRNVFSWMGFLKNVELFIANEYLFSRHLFYKRCLW